MFFNLLTSKGLFRLPENLVTCYPPPPIHVHYNYSVSVPVSSKIIQILQVRKLKHYHITTESWVRYKAEDEFVPGNLLFVDQNALRTTDGTTTSPIAGLSESAGYIEGVGANARFSYIRSFIQLSRSHVILTDYGNHCVRCVDRTTNETSTYTGNCTNRGNRDGVNALFYRPASILVDLMNFQQLIISEFNSRSLKTINTACKNVSIFYRDITHRYHLNHLLQDAETGNIHVTFSHSVGLYNYQSRTFSIITGSTSSGFVDGEFSQLRFDYPRGLAFLSRSTVLVADQNNHKLRVLDLRSNTSSSICSGARAHADGGLASCSLFDPLSLFTVNNTVYIGEGGFIRVFQGKNHINTSLNVRALSGFYKFPLPKSDDLVGVNSL